MLSQACSHVTLLGLSTTTTTAVGNIDIGNKTGTRTAKILQAPLDNTLLKIYKLSASTQRLKAYWIDAVERMDKHRTQLHETFQALHAELETAERAALAAFDAEVTQQRKRFQAEIESRDVLRQQLASGIHPFTTTEAALPFETLNTFICRTAGTFCPPEQTVTVASNVLIRIFQEACWVLDQPNNRIETECALLQKLFQSVSAEITQLNSLRHFVIKREVDAFGTDNTETPYRANRSVAVNSDGTILAVCNDDENNITLYDLLRRKKLRTICGLSQLNCPEKICFAPPVFGYDGESDEECVLVADCGNCRILEISLTDERTRDIGEREFDMKYVYGVDANSQHIVACTYKKVFVFDRARGLLKHSFVGDNPQLERANAVKISPGGEKVAVSECPFGAATVLLFTIAGEFIKQFRNLIPNNPRPIDLCFASCEVLVILYMEDAIQPALILRTDTSETLCCFGDRKFGSGLTLHHKTAYVLDDDRNIRVFE